jgi:hypothetical protein
MSIRYISKETAPSVSSFSTVKAHGTFVIVTVEVENRERSAQMWDSKQSSLLVGGSTYEEAFNAENGPDEHSLVWSTLFSRKLQAGETKTGDLVYDLPHSAMESLEHEGAVVAIRDFGEENENKEAYGGVLIVPK